MRERVREERRKHTRNRVDWIQRLWLEDERDASDDTAESARAVGACGSFAAAVPAPRTPNACPGRLGVP